MSTRILLRDTNAPKHVSQLMIIDRNDANALVDFVERHTPEQAFSVVTTRHHFMTRHVVECDGDIERDVYVVNRKVFFMFISNAIFLIGRETWKNAPIVKEMVAG